MSKLILPAGVSRRTLDPDAWEKVTHPMMPTEHETLRHPAGLVAIRSRDMGRWHLSVSYRDRVPTWGELGFARDCLIPADVWMMIPHPPRKYWMNVDRRVLHLWEFRDETLIEQFKWEGAIAQSEGVGEPDDGQ